MRWLRSYQFKRTINIFDNTMLCKPSTALRRFLPFLIDNTIYLQADR